MLNSIRVFTHASIGIKSNLGMIYVDPFQMKEAPKDAAFILITHDHFDHFSPEDIAKTAGENTVLVVPENMKGKAKEAADLVSRIETVVPGIQCVIDGLEIETVPAYNKLKPFHPKSAGWVGYIINVGGKRLYIAGDTDATKEAAAVKCDIAFIPVGGTYTMDVKQAAKLVNAMRPQTVIPIHYGTVAGKPTDGKEFARQVDPSIKVEVIMGK